MLKSKKKNKGKNKIFIKFFKKILNLKKFSIKKEALNLLKKIKKIKIRKKIKNIINFCNISYLYFFIFFNKLIFNLKLSYNFIYYNFSYNKNDRSLWFLKNKRYFKNKRYLKKKKYFKKKFKIFLSKYTYIFLK